MVFDKIPMSATIFPNQGRTWTGVGPASVGPPSDHHRTITGPSSDQELRMGFCFPSEEGGKKVCVGCNKTIFFALLGEIGV